MPQYAAFEHSSSAVRFAVFVAFRCILQFCVESNFSVIALDHSAVLIYWVDMKRDHIETTNFETTYYTEFCHLNFRYRKSGKNTSENEINAGGVDCYVSQFKVNSLKEDTQYDFAIKMSISATQKGSNWGGTSTALGSYTAKGRTSIRRNSVPEKPAFTWYITKEDIKSIRTELNELNVQIVWIPCGEKRDCHGKEPGTHFTIKYKILDLRRTSTIIEYSRADHNIPYLFAGRIYEMIVTSINGDFKIDSDPQEVFLPPISSPVHSVKILPLTDTSVYISWKEPRDTVEKITTYFLSHISDSMNTLHWADYHKRENMAFPEINQMEDLNQGVVGNLTPNMMYTFFIIPVIESGLKNGLEYRFDYSPQVIQANNLTLGKPDFKFKRWRSNTTHCSIIVYWLPCIEVHDCKNMNPGSGFELRIENGNESKTYAVQEQSSIKIEEMEYDRIYKFLGKSVNKFNQSSGDIEKLVSVNHETHKLIVEDVQSNPNNSNLKSKREKLEL